MQALDIRTRSRKKLWYQSHRKHSIATQSTQRTAARGLTTQPPELPDQSDSVIVVTDTMSCNHAWHRGGVMRPHSEKLFVDENVLSQNVFNYAKRKFPSGSKNHTQKTARGASKSMKVFLSSQQQFTRKRYYEEVKELHGC